MIPVVPAHLPAKSPRKPDGEVLTLERHCSETEEAARLLFRLDGRWGQSWCRFFGIADDQRARWLLNLRIACLAHDLGKANADFVAAVTSKGMVPQGARHEHLSALFLHVPAVRDWLRACPDLDVDVITAAVLSHHIKVHDGSHLSDPALGWGSLRPDKMHIQLHFQHSDVQAILDKMAEAAGLPRLLAPKVPDYGAKAWQAQRTAGAHAAFALWKDTSGKDDTPVGNNAPRQSMLLATKAGVIVSDGVASGLFREKHGLANWIERVVHGPALSPEDLDAEILKPRVAELEKKSGTAFHWHHFQHLAAQQPSRALLMAACGAGKSLAAYRWAQAQLGKHALGSLLFLYPTRGTATEGFRDYIGHAPETQATLLHGSSVFELAGIAENPSEATAGKTYTDDKDARLYALGVWGRRYFSATVDQFLSFMEHRYESLCLLPVLADSVVIIDEVHSFSDSMLRSLLAFLRRFDVPVLCMTATLLPQRRALLENAGLHAFPDQAEKDQLADLQAAGAHPRYRHEPLSGKTDALQRAVAAYRANRRVLWVVNTVRRCQEAARAIQAELGFVPLCYHSRFKLMDRKDRHQSTVAAFQQTATPQIAVTTQVCEMSLDLDADVLITERAPPSSLVQRFGRCNRKLTGKAPGFMGELLTYPPETPLPYTKDDLADAQTFLTAFSGPTSQAQLGAALDTLPRRGGTPSVSTSFLTGGYFAMPGAFREDDAFGATAILRTDVEAVVKAHKARAPIDGWLMTVPRKQCLQVETPSALPPHIRLVDEARYNSELGFLVATEDG